MRRDVDEKKRFRLPMVISSVVWFWFVGAVSFRRPRGLGQGQEAGGLKR